VITLQEDQHNQLDLKTEFVLNSNPYKYPLKVSDKVYNSLPPLSKELLNGKSNVDLIITKSIFQNKKGDTKINYHLQNIRKNNDIIKTNLYDFED